MTEIGIWTVMPGVKIGQVVRMTDRPRRFGEVTRTWQDVHDGCCGSLLSPAGFRSGWRSGEAAPSARWYWRKRTAGTTRRSGMSTRSSSSATSCGCDTTRARWTLPSRPSQPSTSWTAAPRRGHSSPRLIPVTATSSFARSPKSYRTYQSAVPTARPSRSYRGYRGCRPAFPHAHRDRHAHLFIPDELAGVDRVAALDRASERGAQRRVCKRAATRRGSGLHSLPADCGAIAGLPDAETGHHPSRRKHHGSWRAVARRAPSPRRRWSRRPRAGSNTVRAATAGTGRSSERNAD